MTRPAPIIAGTLATLLLLFGAYMGAYYAMLEGAVTFASPPLVNVTFHPVYRLPGVAVIFKPAHQIDRLIRPRYWQRSTTAPGAP